MEVKTIYVNYDIRRLRPPNLIAFTHEKDKNTQVIELHLTDGDEPMTLAADYTYTAAIVNSDTKALINDSIDCELNEDGNVLIPIDDLHVRGRQSLKIELTVTDEQGEQVLSLPFPIWVKVSGSILDDAQVTHESEGTVPELLEEAKEALENAGDYENLENKPQINGHELVGNKSSDSLGLQKKLTAGENITIDANGEISATGGTDDYEELTNKPQINGHELSGNKTAAELRLQDEIKYTLPSWSTQGLKTGDLFIFGQKLYRWQGAGESFMRIGRQIHFSNYNPPEYNETTSVSPYDTGDLFVKKSPNQAANSQGQLSGADVYLCTNVLYWPTYGRMHYAYTWQKINIEKLGVTITSATVNQNGTITFTMSDGSTVTTTGESVIGPQGDDYVLTPQDKTDIANIVLSELPTTQGVQYGNTSN